MEEKPKNNEVVKLIGEARELIAEDMDTEAILRLRKAIKLSPDNVDALLLYAQVSPNRENARKTLNRVLSLDPGSTEARLLLKRIDKEENLEAQSEISSVMPTINIVNNNDNSNTNDVSAEASAAAFAGGGVAAIEEENKVARWVGFAFALFGLFGIGYMINGKVLSGLAYLLIGGPIFILLVATIAAAGAEIALICAIPIYLVGVWQHAKAGAKREPKLIPFSFGRA